MSEDEDKCHDEFIVNQEFRLNPDHITEYHDLNIEQNYESEIQINTISMDRNHDLNELNVNTDLISPENNSEILPTHQTTSAIDLNTRINLIESNDNLFDNMNTTNIEDDNTFNLDSELQDYYH